MKSVFRIAAIVSVATLLSTSVMAQGFGPGGPGGGGGFGGQGPGGGQGGPGGGQNGGPRMACMDDAQKFCSGVQPGGGRIIDCLMDHYKEVSDPCYNALDKLQKLRQQRGGQGGGDNNGTMPPPPPQGGDMPPPPQDGGEPPSSQGGDAPPMQDGGGGL